jgi:hypothetical protein
MTRRKGEITVPTFGETGRITWRSQPKRCGLKNNEVIFCCCRCPVGHRRSRTANGDPGNNPTKRVVQDESKVQNVSSCRRTGPIYGQRCGLRFGLKV